MDCRHRSQGFTRIPLRSSRRPDRSLPVALLRPVAGEDTGHRGARQPAPGHTARGRRSRPRVLLAVQGPAEEQAAGRVPETLTFSSETPASTPHAPEGEGTDA